MRLINTTTYELEEHHDPPPYAILSHTWQDKEEVLYADYMARTGGRKIGHQKIEFLCWQARQDRLAYAWIDTACIDKSSSAELSEAINSMFRWYQKARVCYVYLQDADNIADIENSRWLTRGWTLQELLAPANVQFYSRSWTPLGTKKDLVTELVQWTRIDQAALEHTEAINHFTAATRMKWAARRCTTRVEDMAYCLLGIFDVNLPLLYGERTRAFLRLQEEILRRHHDLTLLVFSRENLYASDQRLLAIDPAKFDQDSKVVDLSGDLTHCEVISGGLKLEVSGAGFPDQDSSFLKPPLEESLILLGCRFEFDADNQIALSVKRYDSWFGASKVSRFSLARKPIRRVPWEATRGFETRQIMLHDKIKITYLARGLEAHRSVCRLKLDRLLELGFQVLHAEPQSGVGSWNSKTMMSEIPTVPGSDRVFIRKFGVFHVLRDEAFIVMFADSLNNLTKPTMLLATKTKPRDVHYEDWLRKESIYGTTPDLHWSDEKFSIWNKVLAYGGTVWDILDRSRVRQFPLSRSIPLQSDHSFTQVEMKLTRDVQARCWLITLDLDTHSDGSFTLNEIDEKKHIKQCEGTAGAAVLMDHP